MDALKQLIGKKITKITGEVGSGEIHFKCSNGMEFRMYHEQDCCENVSVEDICGDLEDLIGSKITQADEDSNSTENGDGRIRWTFYKFATAKGYVTIRWLGSSNGYYSERVDFERVK